MGDGGNGESVLSAQFCHEAKTALKHTVYFLKLCLRQELMTKNKHETMLSNIKQFVSN